MEDLKVDIDNERTSIYLGSVHNDESSSCGYCKNPKGWVTTGFYSPKMTPSDYERLSNYGWRRCGNYYYKPNLELSCCRAYSIRVMQSEFKVSKSQKKVLKRFEKFLKGETENTNNSMAIEEDEKKENLPKSKSKIEADPQFSELISKTITNFNSTLPFPLTQQEFSELSLKPYSGDKMVFVCNYIMLFERRAAKDKREVLGEQIGKEFSDFVKSELEFTVELKSPQHFLIFKSSNKSNSTEIHEIQKPIPITKPKFEKKSNPLKANPIDFEIKLEKASCTDEKFQLYQRYCAVIHSKSDEKKESFENFLCLKALNYQTIQSNDQQLTLGCFHLNYYFNSKLVAVGVVDITPSFLSSVYFFYDPEYSKLSLGVLGALKELEFIEEKKKYFPQFQYYYLGYFIHNSSKMNYKSDYRPCQLMCPIYYNWFILDKEIEEKVKNSPKPTLSTNTKLKNQEMLKPSDLELTTDETKSKKYLMKAIKIKAGDSQMTLAMLGQSQQKKFIEVLTKAIPKWGMNFTSSVDFL